MLVAINNQTGRRRGDQEPPNSVVVCSIFTSLFFLPRFLFTSQKHDPLSTSSPSFLFLHFLSPLYLTLHSLSFLLLFSPSVSYLTPSLLFHCLLSPSRLPHFLSPSRVVKKCESLCVLIESRLSWM
ncbi:MAG: hypothetical protein JOS17DRAFT_759485 [Linnemannia elongata]|nr:MAG: hypothetical protein JOS17DRAFT_759485 [Linnemannia elongata]